MKIVERGRHYFGSARDAIDAASAYEATTTLEVQYDIRIDREGWSVACRDELNDLLGYLAPA